MTTRTKAPPRLYTIPDWYTLMEKHLGFYPGLSALEQAEYQSEKHGVCVNCLSRENLVHQTDRALIKSTDYYMCQPCLDYYEAKHKGGVA